MSQRTETPKVVKVQWALLQDDVTDKSQDIETWTLAYLLDEHVNYIIKEIMVCLRYENEEQEEVCLGAVHRPYNWTDLQPCVLDLRRCTSTSAGHSCHHLRILATRRLSRT
jgi:hypothetical protein